MLDFINAYKFDKKSLRVGLVSNNSEVIDCVYQYIIDNYKVLEYRNSKDNSMITFIKDGKNITISHIQTNQSLRGYRFDYMMIDKYLIGKIDTDVYMEVLLPIVVNYNKSDKYKFEKDVNIVLI